MIRSLTWTLLAILFGVVPPPVQAQTEPARAPTTLRVAVISDLNGRYGSTRYGDAVHEAIDRIKAMRPDLVISTGDMVAGQRRRPRFTRRGLQSMWRAFHRAVTDPLAAAHIPFAITPGNHDASAYEEFGLERRTYGEQWRNRTEGLRFVDRADFPYRYAFAAGRALFISLDGTRIGELDPGQKTWLRELLRERGPEYEWRIVFSHLPLWPFSRGRQREVMADHELEEILREGHVDLYLSGHHQAFYYAYKDGVHYVSQACLGSGPRRLIGTDERSQKGFTILELRDDGSLNVADLTEPDFREPLDIHGLPERIESPEATLIRADLTPAIREVPPAEVGHP